MSTESGRRYRNDIVIDLVEMKPNFDAAFELYLFLAMSLLAGWTTRCDWMELYAFKNYFEANLLEALRLIHRSISTI